MKDLLDTCDATGIAEAIRSGNISAREVVSYAIERVAERNPVINAITEQRAEQALAEAETPGDGPLAGVPFVIKDHGAAVAGMHTTSGSRLRANKIAAQDSVIVERYRRAGLIIIGIANTPEFARSPSTEPVLFGATRNPYDLSRTAGGSSGGTAAAVASGMVPAGHGNDGGGSIRIPASACGLVGLKPTRARTPSHPRLSGFSYPLGVNHALTRTVRDSALLLDLTAGPSPGDAYAAPPPARPYAEQVSVPPGPCVVAVSTTTPSGTPVHPEAHDAALAMGKLMESLGHHVEEATPPYPADAVRLAMQHLMSVPLAMDIDATLTELGRDIRDDDLEPFTRMLYERGKAASGTEYAAALQAAVLVGVELAAFFKQYDVLVTPTMPVPPIPLGLLDPTSVESIARHAAPLGAFTAFCNASGQPAISLPTAHYADGLPLGVQLVAAYGREGLLLHLAAQVESAKPWNVLPVWPPQQPVAEAEPVT